MSQSAQTTSWSDVEQIFISEGDFILMPRLRRPGDPKIVVTSTVYHDQPREARTHASPSH